MFFKIYHKDFIYEHTQRKKYITFERKKTSDRCNILNIRINKKDTSMINIILSIYYILDKISIYLATLMIKGKRLEGLYILHPTNHRLGIFKTCLYILHPTNHRLGIFKTCLYILHPTNHRLGIFKSCLYILHPTNYRLGIFKSYLYPTS